MTVAPFLKRELIVSVRRGGAFADRRVSALLPAVVVVGSVVVWHLLEWDPSAIESAAWFALSTFGCVIASLTFLAIGLVPSLVAPAIASERDRRSLDSLLATRLSASEIVLGGMASGLLRYGNSLAAALPLVLLLVFVGGVNPWLVVLAVAGLVSTAIALASLAIAVSATARTTSRAMTRSVGLAMAWICIPQLIVILLPR